MQFLKLLALPLMLVTTAAAAQGATKEHSVSGPAAQDIRAGWFGKLNPDCSAGHLPQARLINSAANGPLSLASGGQVAGRLVAPVGPLRFCFAVTVGDGTSESWPTRHRHVLNWLALSRLTEVELSSSNVHVELVERRYSALARHL
jgi:hypothetical protein